MKLSKKQAKNMLSGWELVKKHNKLHDNKITEEQFIEAFFTTLEENKEFCVKCLNCDKCK